jgi:hypothetical protein
MSNSGKVKCTCGWSWNKSDSSKKDMYICHECGRDNSNNIKNGGWLNDIEKSQNGKKVLPETEADRAKKVARQVAGATGIGMVLDQFPGVETTYDVYNVIDAYRQGDPMKILPNMLGALIPGTAGKAFEAITDEYLPNTPEKEKQKMKAVLKGKRATPKQMKKAQESVDWSGGFKKLYDDVSSLFEEPSLIDKEKVIKYFNNNRKVQLENGGWLDNYADGGTMQEHQENYNDPQVSLPEGFVGMGNNTKGRNYSPAWGGQFQMGGNIYPVNYVPQAQMGASIPGAVGFSYARVGAPSKGPRRNQTDVTDASAQNGFKFDPKKFAEDQKANTPIQRSIDKEAQSENLLRYTNTKKYQDWVKAKKKAIVQDRKTRIKNSVDAQDKPFTKDNWRQQLADETQATGDKFRLFPDDPDSFIDDYLNPGVMIGNMASSLGSAPLRAEQEDSYMPYVTAIGTPLTVGALAGYGANSNSQFVNNLVNPLAGINPLTGLKNTVKALGTEEGLLSNAWKLNPRAYQYNLPENTMWRGLGKTGLDDALENEVLRTANKTGNYGEDLYITTDFNTAKGNYSIDQPTYKGDPFSEIDDWEQILPKDTKSYIAEIPESALTNKNIVNNSSIVINKGSIPTNDVRLLKQDWWQGYKPIEVPTSSLENSYPSFKQITNAPENINAEHLAGLIKREADWLRSPEYLKRKMNATGRSEASIKKESEEIINHINNTSIDYTGTNESMNVGLYSPGKNPKIRVFDGIPEYPYSDHPFYTGTLDHEVKHAFSESAYTSNKALDFIQNTGYKNYPKANLNKTFGDRVKSAFDMNWANLSAEQQVTGRRMMDVIEKDQGIKRGTELTDANIDQLVESLKLNRYVDDDIYHVATQFKRKFGDDYKKHLKDFLNKAWMSVPAVIGLDAASETDKKKDGGVIKDDMGYWNPDNWDSPVEIGSNEITMKDVPFDVLGISDEGDIKHMKPGKNYKFKGKKVTEFPMAKNGLRQEQKGLVNLDQLTNFTNYNKPQPGGWLNKYN